MNTVSTNTSASSAASSTGTAAKTASTNSKNENDKGFQEELKAASAEEKNSDTETTAKTETKTEKDSAHGDENLGLMGGVQYTDFKYGNGQQLITSAMQDLTNTRNMMWISQVDASKLETVADYRNIQMSDNDALFFADLVQSTDKTTTALAGQIQQALDSGVENLQQPAKVSATLLNAITEAAKNNQPVRIDFDKDVSVIIRVNSDGSISAKFIPGDKAAEQYLRNNIGLLKERFDEQDIPYQDLSHSNAKQQQQQRRNKNKENQS